MAMKYSETVKKAAQNYYEMLGLALARKENASWPLSVPAWGNLPEEAKDAHYQAAELVLETRLEARAGDVGKDAVKAAADSYLERDMAPGERLHAMRALDDVLRRVGAPGYQGRLGMRGAGPSWPGYPRLAALMQSPSARPGIFAAVEHLMVHSGCANETLGRLVVGLSEGAEKEYAQIGTEIRSWHRRLYAGDDEDQRRMNGAMASALAGPLGERLKEKDERQPETALAALERVRATCEALLNAEAGNGWAARREGPRPDGHGEGGLRNRGGGGLQDGAGQAVRASGAGRPRQGPVGKGELKCTSGF